MKRFGIIAIAAALAAASPLQAQTLQFGGTVLNRDLLMPADLASLSQTHAFGTARAMGMGGAFVSLGADMTSISLNPAGLGMYRRNEIALTPLVSAAHAETAGTQAWQKNGKTQFAFANVGAALNVFERSTGSLTSLTIGFGMNRIADFNNRYSFSSESRYDPSDRRPMPTIAEIFGQQLGQAGIFPSPAEGGDPNGSLGYGYNPGFWPAILGYNGYMISVEDRGQGDLWYPGFIGHNASVIHSLDVVDSGSINEFSLAVGGNIDNIVYFGASVGIQSIHKKSKQIYQEEYLYDGPAAGSDGSTLAAQLAYSSLYQQTVVDGSGVNFKVGVTVRPIAGLRLGVALHTPTYYSLDFSYRGDIETLGQNNTTGDKQFSTDATPTQRDEGADSWDFVSPTRLMFGASYTIGDFAIVSVDYERDWYNGIRVKNLPAGLEFGTDFYKQSFKHGFCATNTLRAGIEVKPLPILALRLGGGYTDSMLKDRAQYSDSPTLYESSYFAAGIGISLARNTVLDVAYQHVTQKRTAYQLFFSQDAATGDMFTYSGLYDTELTRHYISLTLGFRF